MKQRLFSPTLSIISFLSWLLLSSVKELHAFSPSLPKSRFNYKYNKWNCDRTSQFRKNCIELNLSAKSSLPNVSEMKAGELRKELQSYGISTRSFFEKSELVDAVEKARREGNTAAKDTSSSDGSSGAKDDSDSNSKSSNTSSTSSRQEKLVEEMEKCQKMKVGELKKELQSYGVSTKSFFEKSEFVRAVAEARVDGVKKTSGSTQSRDEGYDPSYRDVQMQKIDKRTLMGSPVIDVRLG